MTSDLYNSYYAGALGVLGALGVDIFPPQYAFSFMMPRDTLGNKKSDFDLIYNIFSFNVGFKSTAFYRSVSHYFKYNFCICYSQVWLTLEIQ